MVWQGTIGRTPFQLSNSDVIGRWMGKRVKSSRHGSSRVVVNTTLSRTFRGTVMRDIDRHYRRLNEPRGPRLNHSIWLCRAINRQVAYSRRIVLGIVDYKFVPANFPSSSAKFLLTKTSFPNRKSWRLFTFLNINILLTFHRANTIHRFPFFEKNYFESEILSYYFIVGYSFLEIVTG